MADQTQTRAALLARARAYTKRPLRCDECSLSHTASNLVEELLDALAQQPAAGEPPTLPQVAELLAHLMGDYRDERGRMCLIHTVVLERGTAASIISEWASALYTSQEPKTCAACRHISVAATCSWRCSNPDSAAVLLETRKVGTWGCSLWEPQEPRVGETAR